MPVLLDTQFKLDEWAMDYGGCAHDWEVKFELPFGDPNSGKVWSRPVPDMGTYQGGTFPPGGTGPGPDRTLAPTSAI